MALIPIEPFKLDHVREATLHFDRRKKQYSHMDSSQEGMPAFERCVENTWVMDKLRQVDEGHRSKLFDFGCNKANYILEAKKIYGFKTYGIDLKAPGKRYTDVFVEGMFNSKRARKLRKMGPFDVATSISAVEHAGCGWHPDEKRIRQYQIGICEFMICLSSYFFLTVPFGKRPGWARDESRKNLYQFSTDMLDEIRHLHDKNYLEEIYKVNDGYWDKCSRDDAAGCRYRSGKQGASAIALISIWG